MNLLQRYKEYIKEQNLFSSKDKLLLAVSGGVDSVVLCELTKQAGYDFVIAHCNFQLRGEESKRDKEFVKELAKKYYVDFFLKEFETKEYAAAKKISIQEAARELRYNWFYEIVNGQWSIVNGQTVNAIPNLPAGQAGSPITVHYILTAHHADDNIETVLINFFRGTGIKGLKGIEPKHGHIVRPLLFAKREELEIFLVENKLQHVEDSSNREDYYTRNYFRNQLIPSLQNIFPEVKENLLNNIQRLGEAAILYQQAVVQQKKKLLEIRGAEVHIPVLKLKKTEPLRTVIYEIIKDYGFSTHQVDEMIALLDSESGKYIVSGSYRILKNRNWLIIASLVPGKAETILIETDIKNLEFEMGRLDIEYNENSTHTPHILLRLEEFAELDAAQIQFPLILRKWKPGDYFYPLGMKNLSTGKVGKKKLSRFFIDRKLSKTDKEKIWVLEMNKKIIWIVGLRIDERFKITGNTKTIFQIHFTKRQTG